MPLINTLTIGHRLWCMGMGSEPLFIMESKALALGKQVKAEALNSSIHQIDRKR